MAGDSRPFSLTAERYDQLTFVGRYRKMLDVVDPSTLLASDAQVHAAVKLLQSFKEQRLPAGTTAAELWAARKLKESAVHPDSGDLIPRPFRMAGYVPFNGPVCVAMVVAQSTPGLLLWNVVNQSQNALVNYYNRNATAPTTTADLAQSYTVAVGTAVAVSFGLARAIRSKASPELARTLLKWVPFPASALASSANCYIMRRPELVRGIELTDDKGRVVADGQQSQVAAARAVRDTVISRAFLSFPALGVPALVMSLPPVARLCARRPRLELALSTSVTLAAFGFGLPATIAMFPQTGSIDVAALEPTFRQLRDADGQPLRRLYFNKGL